MEELELTEGTIIFLIAKGGREAPAIV